MSLPLTRDLPEISGFLVAIACKRRPRSIIFPLQTGLPAALDKHVLKNIKINNTVVRIPSRQIPSRVFVCKCFLSVSVGVPIGPPKTTSGRVTTVHTGTRSTVERTTESLPIYDKIWKNHAHVNFQRPLFHFPRVPRLWFYIVKIDSRQNGTEFGHEKRKEKLVRPNSPCCRSNHAQTSI